MNSETGSARQLITQRLIVLADQADRETWLAQRRQGLGGSDMAAICDESSYTKPIDVWNAKVHGIDSAAYALDTDRTDRLEMGHVLEPMIVGQYAHGRWRPAGTIPRTVWRPPMVARRDRPWHMGSADGLSVDNGAPAYLENCGALADLCPPDGSEWWDELAECKTHGFHASLAYREAEGDDSDDFDEEAIPADKLIQCAWYTGLWEVPRIRLLALLDTHLRRSWTWARNPQLEADLLTIGEEWWKKHVVEGWMPDPDGSKRYRAHIRSLFGKDTGVAVRADARLEAVVSDLRRVREEKKTATKEAERLAQVIQMAMGNATTLLTSHGKITWTTGAGRVALRPAIDAVYRDAGWSGERITTHEEAHRGASIRTFRVPQAWSKK